MPSARCGATHTGGKPYLTRVRIPHRPTGSPHRPTRSRSTHPSQERTPITLSDQRVALRKALLYSWSNVRDQHGSRRHTRPIRHDHDIDPGARRDPGSRSRRAARSSSVVRGRMSQPPRKVSDYRLLSPSPRGSPRHKTRPATVDPEIVDRNHRLSAEHGDEPATVHEGFSTWLMRPHARRPRVVRPAAVAGNPGRPPLPNRPASRAPARTCHGGGTRWYEPQ